MHRYLSRALTFSLAMIAPAIATTSGCTPQADEPTSQCHSQADCLARGPEFADTTCNEQRICVKAEVAARSCNTNKECADRNGGAPFICRADGKCMSLLTPECQQVFADKDDLINDNTIFFGHVDIGDIN